MSLKTKAIIEKSFKIAIISLLILLTINLGFNYSNKDYNYNQNITLNAANNKKINSNYYANINIRPIATVAIAISTNLGIQYFKKNTNTNLEYIYNNIYSSKQIISKNKNIFQNIIGKNLLYIKDYYNFIKTDFNKILNKSNNRKNTLNIIIKQLDIRLENANKNATFLINQRNILNKDFQDIKNKIENIKNKIRKDYKDINIENLNLNMNNYYYEKNKEIILNTYILYINDLLKKYLILNNYNKILLNTLKLNKDIISKKSYIVIPREGTKILKQYNLILTQEEYNKQKK